MTTSIVILGATGDLTSRYLFPALVQLISLGHLDEDLQIVGVAQDPLDADGFRAHVAEQLRRHAGTATENTRSRLVAASTYVSGDVTDPAVLATALAATRAKRCDDRAVDAEVAGDGPRVVVYLALPHVIFERVVAALGECELPRNVRVVVEKPFGQDLAGAQRLNAALARVISDDHTFRVDHFLAKQTVLNVLGLRFANRVFEPLWSNAHITAVDIVFDETVDAQDRASYYDRSGALRDMVQNHLLQVLTYIAMEPPLSMEPADLSDRKLDVLRAVRAMDRAEVAAASVRGRYTAGEVTGPHGDRHVAAYVDADGVDPGRDTETYAEVTLRIDNWRWAGVPFRLRTGKALACDRREVVIRFADVPHDVFAGPGPPHNELRLQLDPDRMSLRLNVNGIGDPFDLETVELDVDLAQQDPSAYGQLLLAVIDGDTRLSARAGEAEQGWRIVEPVLQAWADGTSPLRDYAAGSDGPST